MVRANVQRLLQRQNRSISLVISKICVHVQLHGQMHTYADVPSVLVHSHHAMHSTNYGGQNLFDVAFQILL